MTTPLRSLALLKLSLTFLLAASFAAAQPPNYPLPQVPQEAGEPPPVPEGDIAVQPRGPVHEAFALPPNMAPQPGPILAKRPPDPIPEVPPDQRLEGDNVQWIPGYWAWNAGRQDYLWVSGLWRVPPAGCKWVPGAWNAVEGGYQWSPGFWAPVGQEEMPYLPPPPASLDNGPNSPPPDDDSFYVPGCWRYQSSRYAWQPGYWQAYRPGMMWMTSSYSWTPSGYLYVPGYWDWPLEGRGLPFAPVAFNRPLWNTPGWSYQPSYGVPFSGLLSSLFLGPAGSGYYFGNYYGPAYRRLGFQPWFATTNGVYNPLFSWYRWRNANNPGWLDGLYATYRGRSNGTLNRPPLTFGQQTALLNKTGNLRNNTFNSLHMLQPLRQYNGVRLARLNTAQIAEQRNQAQRLQQVSAQRQNIGRAALRETKRSLPLSHPVTVAPAVHGRPASPGSAAPIRPAHAIAPKVSEPRIITAHHATTGPAAHPAPHPPPAPRIQTSHAPPSAPRNGVIPHPPTPAAHRAAPAPAHHSAPPARPAPSAHHAQPKHGGGGHGGHGGGRGGHGGGHHR